MLDEYAKAEALRAKVAEAFALWRDLGTKLEELNRNEQEKLRLLDLWTFQRKEIDGVQPRLGEDSELEARAEDSTEREQAAGKRSRAFAVLYDAPESATTQLKTALKRWTSWCALTTA